MHIELLHTLYSPWSEKARWALEHHGIDYVSKLFQPLLGEAALRWKLRRLRGRVSVPVLTADGVAIADSFEIAKFAERHGHGAPLFPNGTEREIEAFNTTSERGLAAGRALSLERMLADREAVLEMVPKNMQPLLGLLAEPIAAFGVRRTLRKYGALSTAQEEHARVLEAALESLRAKLAAAPSTSEPRTLLGTFSYADIAMAQLLAFVQPPASGLKLGLATARVYADPPLAARFEDLVHWRDSLYTALRGQ